MGAADAGKSQGSNTQPTVPSSSVDLSSSFLSQSKDWLAKQGPVIGLLWLGIIVSGLLFHPATSTLHLCLVGACLASSLLYCLSWDFGPTFFAWIFYASPPIFFTSYLLLLYSIYALGPLLVVLISVTYYWFTCRGRPHVTGARRWNWLCSQQWIFDCVARYFSTKFVGHTDLAPDTPYIFGFHPHGLYPGTVVWSPLTTLWTKHFAAKTRPIFPLGATIMFYWPFLRDLFLWTGVRDVSVGSFRKALATGNSVAIIPGGMKEMFHSRARSPTTVLVAGHKGFVREAILAGRSLVPVFVFGETSVMENFYMPDIQAWFAQVVGFGYPHYPHGRWFLPFPNPVPLTIAFGKPIPVVQNPNPSPEEINLTHSLYFEELTRVFNAHKHEHPGNEEILDIRA